MEGNVVDINVVVGFFSAIGTGLTSAIVYLFKLHYVDTKRALEKCEENHKTSKVEYEKIIQSIKNDYEQNIASEKEECRSEISKRDIEISSLRDNVSKLNDQVFQLSLASKGTQ